jgi:hypothetical protein
MLNAFPEFSQADLAGLIELQIAAVFRLAERQLEYREGLVKLEGRLAEEGRQEIADANVQARSAARRRLEYLESCVERARARSRKEAIRLARGLISKLRAENLDKTWANYPDLP